MLSANKNLLRAKSAGKHLTKVASSATGTDNWLSKFSLNSIKTTFRSWFDSALENKTLANLLGKKITQVKDNQDKTSQKTSEKDSAASEDTKTNEFKKEFGSNHLNDFQQASFFAASFLFILAISCFSSVKTVRRGVLLGLGGIGLAICASFFTEQWDISDSFRWLVSVLVGGALGFYYGFDGRAASLGKQLCLLQASIGAASFMLGLAEYERYSYLEIEFEGLIASQTMFVCLCGSALFASSLTAYYKIHNKSIANRPLKTIGKHRNTINKVILVTLAVLAIVYIFFEYGWILWTVVFLSLYVFWGLTVSADPSEMNLLIPFQTLLTGATISFVGFLLDMHYLLLTGALCLTGGYKILASSQIALGKTIFSVFFKSWARENADSVVSNQHVGEFGFSNQDINQGDLEHELIISERIIFVPGIGLYSSDSAKALGGLSESLRLLGKQVHFCIHPNSGLVPGHITAVLTESGIPYSQILPMGQVSFSDYDLAVVIGAYEQVDPDNLNFDKPRLTCNVWESGKVMYIETKIESEKNNGLFDKQNVSVLRGESAKLLEGILKEFQKKGLVDMQPEERNLLLQGGNLNAESRSVEAAEPIASEIEALVSKATKICGVLNENTDDSQHESKETRVAVTPQVVKNLLKNGVHLWIENGAGKQSGFSDEQYAKAGAKVTTSNEIFQNAEIMIFISELNDAKVNLIGKAVKLLIAPVGKEKQQVISKLLKREDITFIDLSNPGSKKFSTSANQQILAINRAVLEGFYYLNRLAQATHNISGRSPAAQVLVIGADQLGLSAASVAKQAGANVKVFDKRDGLKSIIKRSGFSPVEFMQKIEQFQAKGYKFIEQNPNEVHDTQCNALVEALSSADLVITTVLNSEGEGEKVLNQEQLQHLRRGGVVVDLVAEQGGNTFLTQLDKVNYDAATGITVIGYSSNSYSQKLNRQSSQLQALNIAHLFNQLSSSPQFSQNQFVDLTNEQLKAVCLIHKSAVVQQAQQPSQNSALPQAVIQEKIADESEIPEAQTPDHKAEENIAVNLIPAHQERNSASVPVSEASVHLDPESKDVESDKNSLKERLSTTLRKTELILHTGKEFAVNFVSDSLSEEREEIFNKNAEVFSVVVTLLLLVVCIALAVLTDGSFIFQLGLFILALFVASTLLNQTDNNLNGILLVFLQAISGSIAVACTHVFSNGQTKSFFTAFSIVAEIGNALAIFAIVAGFIIAIKLSNSFTRQTKQDKPLECVS